MLYVIYICDIYFFATWTSIVKLGQVSIAQYEVRSDVEFEWEQESHCACVKLIQSLIISRIITFFWVVALLILKLTSPVFA